MSLDQSNEEGKTYVCKYCGASFNELWQLGNHVKYECEAARKAKEGELEKGEEGPPEEPKVLEARQLVAQFGREGLNQVKKERLKEVLELAPGVSRKIVPWILRKWDLNARIRDDPQEFYRVLHDECGLKPNIAFSITRDVWGAEEEFADLLYQRGERPIFFRYGYGYGGQPMFGWGYPQQTQASTPVMAPMPGFYSREDVERLRSDWAKEERLRKLEEQLANLYRDLPKMVREAVQSEAPGVQYEEVREPIDAEGNICHPDEAVSVRVRRVPITSKAEREDFLDKFIKLKQAGIIGKEKEIDENTIRRIMREEAERKPESEEIRVLRAQLNESRKAIEDLKEAMEAKDKQLLIDKINDLENRLSALATTSGEWRTDEMKVLAASIHELGTIIKEKHPVEAARELLTVTPAVMPPPTVQSAGPAERNAVIEGLRPYGLVRSTLKRTRNETGSFRYD